MVRTDGADEEGKNGKAEKTVIGTKSTVQAVMKACRNKLVGPRIGTKVQMFKLWCACA